MRTRTIKLIMTAAFFWTGSTLLTSARAQLIDFGQIDAFESLGTATQRGGEAPKKLIDDGDRHIVVLTILEGNTETKVHWKALDGDPANRTTTITGPGVQVFQTGGEFTLEAVGDESRSIKYGYVLFRLKKQ